MSTAHLADVSDDRRVLSPEIRPQWRGASFIGRAFTVTTPPGDNASLHQALDMVEEGDVIVVDGAGDSRRALWGAIMSRAALAVGARALVVDGFVRDIAEIEEMRFPVFALGATPASPYNKIRGRIGVPIVVGGVEVVPGDTVVGDDDGVIVVPGLGAAEVFEKARVRHELEQEIVAGLERNEPLSSLLSILQRGRR